MTEEEFFQAVRRDGWVRAGSEGHEVMHRLARRARRLTARLNRGGSGRRINRIFSRLIGRPRRRG